MRFMLLATTMIVSATAHAAPMVHTTDFINDAHRTQFNGFERIPNDGMYYYTGGNGPYEEDGIVVEQVNGDGPDSIWVTASLFGPHEGRYSWYPDAGDRGYTKITRKGGANFDSVGMLIGTGAFLGVDAYLYELLDDGNVVLSGRIIGPFAHGSIQYLGFSGGGFDTIHLADCNSLSCDMNSVVTDGHFQALKLDSIELLSNTVPEPAPLALIALGIASLSWLRRRP